MLTSWYNSETLALQSNVHGSCFLPDLFLLVWRASASRLCGTVTATVEVLLIFNACPGKAVGVNTFVVILARLCYSYTTTTQKTNLTSYQLLEMVTVR